MDQRQVMVVTGGGRGIGAATVRLAAARGYAVCVNYRARSADAEALVAEARSAGVRAIALAADVSREDEVVRMFARVDVELGRVTALVNNAGVVEHTMRVDEMDAARWTRVLAVNVIGTFLCAREAVRRMSTRHGGSGGAIVNVSSKAAVIGSPGDYVDYAASKGAVETFSLGLAKELVAEGVRVNCVRPGIIDTEIHASSGDAERAHRVGPSLPMKRPGTPEEVAQAILWLVSQEASYTTGSVLEVAGGR
jgi:NAD(P)-dependent dehydrogenase (short-subunit alcohol dehydrogenase family)